MDFILLILGIGLIFYFLIWRPQKKEESDRKALLDSLSKGDRVVMNNGIHGSVASVGDDTLRVMVAPKVEIVVDKGAIATKVMPEKGE